MFIFPTACVASQWNIHLGYLLTILAISSIGCNKPISLFTAHILTSIVSSV